MASSEPLLIDCHSDAIIDVHRRRSAGEERVFERLHLPELRRGGVGASVCTVGGDPACLCPLGTSQALESALLLLETLRDDISPSGGSVQLAGSSEELRQLATDGVFAIIPSLEGAAPLRGDLENVGRFYELGIRVVGLTWNTRNEVAVGLGVEGAAGLTDVGLEAILEMNRAGMVVDISHAAPKTFWDVAQCASAPFIASHSNASSVCDHARNLGDDQLRAVRDSGGMVGVVLYPAFVSEPPVTIEHVLDHVEFLAETIGAEHVGVGADFIDYALEETVAEFVERGIPYTDSDFDYPEGVETCASLSNLLEGMDRRGFTPDEIQQIAGENFLRVLSEVQSAAAH